jgi:hypothetical protein
MSVTINGTSGLTFNDASTQNTAATGFGFKNRLINSDMRIDQRNAGASVNPTDGQYTLDRWIAYRSQASKYTIQQNAGSVTPPVGFSNYLGVTSSSAYSVTSGDYFAFQQRVEGFNFSDLAWGTANAQPITISFWVRSSLTGTFGGSLLNSADNRSYPFSYTISSANTWEQKSITIAGDTTGTWIGATNGTGVKVTFSLGCGSTFSGTVNSWQAGAFFQPTGATSVVGTSGATFYITGVQLEKGSTATSFDYRPYGTELNLCQRYYQIFRAAAFTKFGMGLVANGNTVFAITCPMKVTMRATPTITQSNCIVNDTSGNYSISSITNISSADSISFDVGTSTTGLTAARPALFGDTGSANAVLTVSAEL